MAKWHVGNIAEMYLRASSVTWNCPGSCICLRQEPLYSHGSMHIPDPWIDTCNDHHHQQHQHHHHHHHHHHHQATTSTGKALLQIGMQQQLSADTPNMAIQQKYLEGTHHKHTPASTDSVVYLVPTRETGGQYPARGLRWRNLGS